MSHTRSTIGRKREYLKALDRRKKHLHQRIRDRKGDTGYSYDRQEAAALEWAIGTLTPLLEAEALAVGSKE